MFLLGRSRRRFAVAFFWAAALTAQTPPTSPASKSTTDETCTVNGTVVAKADGTPLKGATIQLQSTTNADHNIAVKSGTDGRFLLKNVPAGDYHLTVSRNGYSELKYGQKKAGDPGALFHLRPGQNMADLLFRMGRAGVISGKVFDEDGEPMVGVEVEALRYIYKDGRQEMVLATSGESNDLGEFRLYGLSPGHYFVSAEQAPWNRAVVGEKEFTGAASNNNEKGYGRVYYPNTGAPDKASTFIVKEGEEIPSIDFLMKEITVYRIRGKVLNLISKHGTENIQVVYTVSAMLFDENKTYSTQQDVDVVTADVDGLVLSLTAGATIPGRINWEGKPSQRKDGTSVYLESEMSRFGMGRADAHIDEDWQFTLKEVPDGTFRVHVVDLSEDCYIKEVRFGDTVLPGRELRVRGAGANLEITVSSRGARVSGTVLNADSLPVSDAWVVAVPEVEKRKFLHLFRARSTDQYGHFEIQGLAPGKYKLFSWEGIEAQAWEDADFLKDYEEKGQEIEVRDDDQKSMDLKLLSAKDSE
jgi:Carboxypeptidase regulatory-like domain